MLQPCIVAAYEEMCRHAGLSGDAARRQVGATGYLDDVTLIQRPEVVVAGLRVFQHEASKAKAGKRRRRRRHSHTNSQLLPRV